MASVIHFVLIVLIPDMDGSIAVIIKHVNDHFNYEYIIIVKCYYTMVAIMNGCHIFPIVVVIIFIKLFLIFILILIVFVIVSDFIFVIVSLIVVVFISDVNYSHQQQLST